MMFKEGDDRNRSGLRAKSEKFIRGRLAKKCKAIFRYNDLSKARKEKSDDV